MDPDSHRGRMMCRSRGKMWCGDEGSNAVMHLQAKGCLSMAAGNHQQLGRGKEGPLLETSRGQGSTHTSTSNF